MKEEKTRLVLFIVLAIVIGWVTILMIPLLGNEYQSVASTIILAAMMFSPVLANVLTRLITKEGFSNFYLKPNFKGNSKKYVLIFFGPTFLLFLSGIVYFLLRPSAFDRELTQLHALVTSPTHSARLILLVSIAQVIVLGPVINLIPTLGEELGWRGYLLPKLRLFCNDRMSLLISGAIWGFWHLPAIVMGHNYGTSYPGYPYLGILMMIFFCIMLGIIEGYVTITMKSAIPAAMIHSTVNAGAALPMLLIKGQYNPLLGPAITGPLGAIPFIIVAIILFIRVGKEKNV